MAAESRKGELVVPAAGDEAPVGDLIREALGDTRELVRLEVALAREDLKSEVGAVRSCAIMMGAAAAALVVSLGLLLVALVFAIGAGWVGALVAGGALLLLAGLLGLAGWRAMPKSFFGETRERLLAEVDTLRERIA